MERKALTYLKWGAVFTFLNLYIGTWNLLPEFVGMLFFLGSIQSHEQPTQAEQALRPLLWVLAADFFLHWIWQFENILESLLILVISLYTIYVLIGEAAERIRTQQPEKAGTLDVIRGCNVVLQSAVFLLSPYGNEVLNVLLVLATGVLMVSLVVALCGVRPVEAA